MLTDDEKINENSLSQVIEFVDFHGSSKSGLAVVKYRVPIPPRFSNISIEEKLVQSEYGYY